jgi:glutaminyl-peptide cyclotransferase
VLLLGLALLAVGLAIYRPGPAEAEAEGRRPLDLLAPPAVGANADSPHAVRRLVAEVIATHPHDRDAFTQGLVFHAGRFYESTGRYGRSDLREVAIESGVVIRSRPLEARFFGEGLALVEDRLIQLTYREGIAIVYDRDTFEELERFAYTGEGWGLCFDGEGLWMSDGSARLQRRDPKTFALVGELPVTRDGRQVTHLNELACIPGGGVVANVWLTNELVWIDTASGAVSASIDASGLVPDDALVRANRDAVLNGVAHDPIGDRWWLTGKLWPHLYEVRFLPAP